MIDFIVWVIENPVTPFTLAIGAAIGGLYLWIDVNRIVRRREADHE